MYSTSHQDYEIIIESFAENFTNSPRDDTHWKIIRSRTEKIVGASGYKHQIDVFLESEKDVLLIECKCWATKNKVPVGEYLKIFGRLKDIEPMYEGKHVRAALVTRSEWQSGVEDLSSAWGGQISLFQVSEAGELGKQIHTRFFSSSGRINFKAQAIIEGKRNV
ncbi:MAG: hypothetical protein RQ761_11670 [Bacteroidales bacterium]|nr:hypothetical protein [Bacteroidales bacterium]